MSMRISTASLVMLAASAATSSVNGFAFLSSSAPHRPSLSPRWMSEPSDTSFDSYDSSIVVESEAYLPTETESLVTSVMDSLPSFGQVSKETRTAINEVLLKLEAMNPTPNPTTSPLLNGVWEMRYAAGYTEDWAVPSPTRQLALFLYSGGYSPGLFALSVAQSLPSSLVTVGDLEISISRQQPRIEAKVDVKLLGGFESTVMVKAQLNVESGMRFSETYESATVLDRTVDLPAPVQYSRDLYVTYVDEDLLVVRDASGVPEVLVRKNKTFMGNWGTEPSAIDDMVAPGEDPLPATE